MAFEDVDGPTCQHCGHFESMHEQDSDGNVVACRGSGDGDCVYNCRDFEPRSVEEPS